MKKNRIIIFTGTIPRVITTDDITPYLGLPNVLVNPDIRPVIELPIHMWKLEGNKIVAKTDEEYTEPPATETPELLEITALKSNNVNFNNTIKKQKQIIIGLIISLVVSIFGTSFTIYKLESASTPKANQEEKLNAIINKKASIETLNKSL